MSHRKVWKNNQIFNVLWNANRMAATWISLQKALGIFGHYYIISNKCNKSSKVVAILTKGLAWLDFALNRVFYSIFLNTDQLPWKYMEYCYILNVSKGKVIDPWSSEKTVRNPKES